MKFRAIAFDYHEDVTLRWKKEKKKRALILGCSEEQCLVVRQQEEEREINESVPMVETEKEAPRREGAALPEDAGSGTSATTKRRPTIQPKKRPTMNDDKTKTNGRKVVVTMDPRFLFDFWTCVRRTENIKRLASEPWTDSLHAASRPRQVPRMPLLPTVQARFTWFGTSHAVGPHSMGVILQRFGHGLRLHEKSGSVTETRLSTNKFNLLNILQGGEMGQFDHHVDANSCAKQLRNEQFALVPHNNKRPRKNHPQQPPPEWVAAMRVALAALQQQQQQKTTAAAGMAVDVKDLSSKGCDVDAETEDSRMKKKSRQDFALLSQVSDAASQGHQKSGGAFSRSRVSFSDHIEYSEHVNEGSVEDATEAFVESFQHGKSQDETKLSRKRNLSEEEKARRKERKKLKKEKKRARKLEKKRKREASEKSNLATSAGPPQQREDAKPPSATSKGPGTSATSKGPGTSATSKGPGRAIKQAFKRAPGLPAGSNEASVDDILRETRERLNRKNRKPSSTSHGRLPRGAVVVNASANLQKTARTTQRRHTHNPYSEKSSHPGNNLYRNQVAQHGVRYPPLSVPNQPGHRLRSGNLTKSTQAQHPLSCIPNQPVRQLSRGIQTNPSQTQRPQLSMPSQPGPQQSSGTQSKPSEAQCPNHPEKRTLHPPSTTLFHGRSTDVARPIPPGPPPIPRGVSIQTTTPGGGVPARHGERRASGQPLRQETRRAPRMRVTVPNVGNVQQPNPSFLPPLQFLCSEAFLESWGDLVGKLASGCWVNESVDETNENVTPPLRSSSPQGRKISLVDSPLVDKSGVDIELPGRCGIIVFPASALEAVDDAKSIVMGTTKLAAIGRFATLYILLCYDGEVSFAARKHIVQLQYALTPTNGLPPTKSFFKTASKKSLAASLAETILQHKEPPTTEKLVGSTVVEGAAEEHLRERARFLLSLLPVLSANGAIQVLQLAHSFLPHGPSFRMLFQNKLLRQQIILSATSDATEIHPYALVQLSRILDAPLGANQHGN